MGWWSNLTFIFFRGVGQPAFSTFFNPEKSSQMLVHDVSPELTHPRFPTIAEVPMEVHDLTFSAFFKPGSPWSAGHVNASQDPARATPHWGETGGYWERQRMRGMNKTTRGVIMNPSQTLDEVLGYLIGLEFTHFACVFFKSWSFKILKPRSLPKQSGGLGNRE